VLVLTRKHQQAVVLTLEDGREITVLVIEARDGKARLGFEAPDAVRILRDELTAHDAAPTAAQPGPARHPALPARGGPVRPAGEPRRANGHASRPAALGPPQPPPPGREDIDGPGGTRYVPRRQRERDGQNGQGGGLGA
jgi:carbon storage regulator CsrA